MQNIIPHNLQIPNINEKSKRDARATFIEKLGRALHRYGLPTHRLEAALVAVCVKLNIVGQFFATPTAIFASLEIDGHQHSLLIRVDPGDVNLDKLSRLDKLLRGFNKGEIGVEDASSEIDTIVNEPRRYGSVVTTLAFAVASAAASFFFGGGWREFLVCGLIGFFAGVIAVLAGRYPSFRLFEPTAAMIAGIVATAASVFFAPTSIYVSMCAGLIILIPGLTLTVAINELATRNLSAGTVRLAGALMLFLQIGFGVAVGVKMGDLFFGPIQWSDPSPLPHWALPGALALCPPAFTILFQARFRDVGWIAGASILAFGGARLGAQLLGVEMGTFLGALLLGIASNLHARYWQRPSSLTLVPGMLLLVPGSFGFQSLSSLMTNDVVTGMETAFTMCILGVALVAGLLLANSIVRSREWL